MPEPAGLAAAAPCRFKVSGARAGVTRLGAATWPAVARTGKLEFFFLWCDGWGAALFVDILGTAYHRI